MRRVGWAIGRLYHSRQNLNLILSFWVTAVSSEGESCEAMNVFLDVEQTGFARRAKTEVGYAGRWFEDGRGATAVVRIDGAQRVWWCGGGGGVGGVGEGDGAGTERLRAGGC